MLVVTPLPISIHATSAEAASTNTAGPTFAAEARLVLFPTEKGTGLGLNDKSADGSRFAQVNDDHVRIFPLKGFDVFKPGEAIAEFPLQLDAGEHVKLLRLMPDNSGALVGVGRFREIISCDIYGDIQRRVSEGSGFDLYSSQGDLLARIRSFGNNSLPHSHPVDLRHIGQVEISSDSKLVAFIDLQGAIQVLEIGPNKLRAEDGTALAFANKAKIMPDPTEIENNGVSQVRFDTQNGALYFSTTRGEMYCLERQS